MKLNEQPVSLIFASSPLIILIGLLSINVYIFKDDAITGSNQIILIFSAAIAAVFAWYKGHRWKDMEEGIVNSIKLATPAILILLLVGALSGAWLVSGIIPTMIYYGLLILNPTIFLFAACVICAIVATFTGSSWTTSATIGIALMGVGKILGLDEGMIAGAILSGAYFGDKLSPLSDTTNLAAASSGTELFTHIRYMLYTTTPSISIALLGFIVLGFGVDSDVNLTDLDAIREALQQNINISPWLLLVPTFVIVMILKKIPALPVLFAGTMLGILAAFLFQTDIVQQIGREYGSTDYHSYIGVMLTLFGDTHIEAGNETLDELLSSGGMAGMLMTIWLILSAMVFGGIMEASGFLARIIQAMISRVHSAASLVRATVGTCIFTNLSTSDQYLAVLLPGRMFADVYKQRGLAPENLSRTLEDSGTVTSVLVPWNTCGAFHAGVLGVATLSYAPFTFFCILSPLVTLVYAYRGIKIAKRTD